MIDFEKVRSHMDQSGGHAAAIIVGYKLYNDLVEMLKERQINSKDIQGNHLEIWPDHHLKHNESYFLGDIP